jgi:hypothetical protein
MEMGTAKEREMTYQFLKVVDEKLLDLVTDPNLKHVFSTKEYEEWKITKSLKHIQSVRLVQDLVAGAYQDTLVYVSGKYDRMMHYNAARCLVGLEKLEDL